MVNVALEVPGRPIRRVRLAVTDAGTLAATGRLYPDEAATLRVHSDVLVAFTTTFAGATIPPEAADAIRAQRRGDHARNG